MVGWESSEKFVELRWNDPWRICIIGLGGWTPLVIYIYYVVCYLRSDNIGESIIFLWTERIREFLVEKSDALEKAPLKSDSPELGMDQISLLCEQYTEDCELCGLNCQQRAIKT